MPGICALWWSPNPVVTDGNMSPKAYPPAGSTHWIGFKFALKKQKSKNTFFLRWHFFKNLIYKVA